MEKIITKLALLIVLGSTFSGCMVSDGLVIQPEPVVIGDPPRKIEYRKKHVGKAKKNHLKIPPGHMPPKGKCRVWYNNRPPGHQPPPISCRTINRKIPYNAVLVRG